MPRPLNTGDLVKHIPTLQGLYGTGVYRVIDCIPAAQPGEFVSDLVALRNGQDHHLEYDIPCWMLERSQV